MKTSKKKKEEERDYTQERDDRVIPVAKKFIKLLAVRDDLMMGFVQAKEPEKTAKYYQKVFQEDVIPLLMEPNLKISDIPFLFSIILQPFQMVATITESSFKNNRALTDAELYKIDDIDELTVNRLDEMMGELFKEKKNPVDN